MMYRTLLLLLLSLGALSATDRNDFHWSGSLVPGQLLEVKGVKGTIIAEPARGPEAEVVASRSSSRSDPSDVEIAVIENGSGVTVCAVYPTPGGGNACQPGSTGRSGNENSDINVDFIVRVPPGVRFSAWTVEGSVGAEHLSADVEAHTVTGKIDISTAGMASASAINGSIHAILTGAVWRDSRTFSTVNGNVELELQPGINANVHATTSGGRIDSDLPIALHGPAKRGWFHATIGKGGPQLKVSTVNGAIHLRQIDAPTV
ncbi:MAG TPA: hypothetical protein VKU01_04225 [Bryobacteraceae bacterium]|nr:hypothetical protein [Bryobacteraceae bacterium]